MSQIQAFQPKRQAARLISGVLGAAIGLGLIASVVQGMGASSAGQSLGQFMAQQRQIATNPVAQAETVQTITVTGRRAPV